MAPRKPAGNRAFTAPDVGARETAKSLGGPGRTRTCNQTVMSGRL